MAARTPRTRPAVSQRPLRYSSVRRASTASADGAASVGSVRDVTTAAPKRVKLTPSKDAAIVTATDGATPPSIACGTDLAV